MPVKKKAVLTPAKGFIANFKKKFTLACMFWVSGSALAFMAKSGIGEYTAFTAVVLGLFKASDVADKHLNGGHYHDGEK